MHAYGHAAATSDNVHVVLNVLAARDNVHVVLNVLAATDNVHDPPTMYMRC